MSRSCCCFRSEEVFFEEALTDKLFQVLSEISAVDGLVPMSIVVRTVFFCSRECGVVLDRFWTSDSWLVLDGVEELIDGSLSGMKCFVSL